MESTLKGSFEVAESPYMDMFDEVQECVIFLDRDHRIRSVNHSTCILAGYSRKDLIGKDIDRVLIKHYIGRSGGVPLSELKCNGDSLNLEFTIHPSNGEEILMGGRIILIENMEGERVYMISAARIINDRATSEELNRLRKDWMVLLQNSSDSVLLVYDGIIGNMNGKAEEIFGYSQGEMIGKGIDDLFRDEFGIIGSGCGQTETTEPVLGMRRDGSVFPAEVNFFSVDDRSGERTFLFVKDISERTQREEKLRLLAGIIETSTDAVFVLNPQGEIITVNTGLKNILDIHGSGVGWDPRMIFGGCEERYLEMIGSLLDGMKWSGYTNLESEGSGIEISIKAWPMMDSSGNVDYLIIHCRDISDVRRIHEDMELLSSVLSHDIRNFDKAITDNLTLLKMGVYGELDEKKEMVISRILSQSKGMNSLITNSRKILQSYREINDLEVFDLRSVVLYAADLIRSSYPERNIDVEASFGDPPPVVRADLLVRDVFQNLLDNSVKYSRGDVRIDVEGSRSEEGWYTVMIRDDGVGMPEGKGEELFGLFKGSRRSGGTGMGLYLVKRLMERFGGRVTSRERSEKEGYGGAEFRLDFPRIGKDTSILYDTINTDLSDPVRYILFRKMTRDGKQLIEFGGDVHDLREISTYGKMDLIERFGWNISKAIHEMIKYVDTDGVYRYDFEDSRISGPIDPRFYGD